MGSDFDAVASMAIPLFLCTVMCFVACYGIRRSQRTRAKVSIAPKRVLLYKIGPRVYIV